MTEEHKLTIREEKHQATSLRVERSAVGLVLQHGFDSVTVDMICEASGISQRTFFNYFKTKDAAVVGADPPRIDEGKARSFIAGAGADVLPELLELMASTAMSLNFDEKLFADRITVFGQNPQLLHKQMERMTRVTTEVTELVFLRLNRAAGPDADTADLHDQAELITHAMFGVLRFVAMRWIPGAGLDPAPGPDPAPSRAESLEQAQALLRRTLRIP